MDIVFLWVKLGAIHLQKHSFSPNSMLLKTNKIELMYLLFLCLILLERQLIMGTKNEGKDKTFLGVGVLLSTNAEY